MQDESKVSKMGHHVDDFNGCEDGQNFLGCVLHMIEIMDKSASGLGAHITKQ